MSSGRPPTPPTCLVVEDDEDLLSAIGRHLETQLGANVLLSNSLARGRELLRRHKPRLIVTDVYLGEERCYSLVKEALSRPPLPAIVAISGSASAEEAFALAASGVRSYLAKPLSLSALRAVVRAALEKSPKLAPTIAAQVGAVPIETVKRDVRVTMLTQALALTAGNRSECAKILGITRQAVQNMIRDLEIDTSKFGEPLK